jgi:hypothetical protein
MDLPKDVLEELKRSNRLERFDAGIDAILKDALGRDWMLAKSDAHERVLTQRQRDWRELRHFYEASIVNSADLFSYLWMIYSRPELFEEIEAVKTLAAAERLRPLHEAYSQLATKDEKDHFWKETLEERLPIEYTAEDPREFAELLIRFAERHPADFSAVEVQNRFNRLSELMGSLRRKAEDEGHETKTLDLLAGMNERIRNFPNASEDGGP